MNDLHANVPCICPSISAIRTATTYSPMSIFTICICQCTLLLSRRSTKILESDSAYKYLWGIEGVYSTIFLLCKFFRSEKHPPGTAFELWAEHPPQDSVVPVHHAVYPLTVSLTPHSVPRLDPDDPLRLLCSTLLRWIWLTYHSQCFFH